MNYYQNETKQLLFKKAVTRFLVLLIAFSICFMVPVSSQAATKTIKTQTAAQIVKKKGYQLKKTGYIKLKNGAKVKATASSKAKTVKKLNLNTKVKYKKYNDKWYIVKYGKKYGFVLAGSLSKKKINTGAKITKMVYPLSSFRRLGVVYWGSWRWTWYSEKVLPGNGLSIPGRHVDDSGYVCDGDNYICLASSTLSKGTILETPFGKQGKIYDSGCAYGTVDVYVH